MFSLVKLFFDLCLLRTKPQDLPHSYLLLVITLALYAIFSYVTSALGVPASNAVLAAVVDTGLMTGLAYGAVWIPSHTERFLKTLLALAGSGAIMEVIALPLLLLTGPNDSGTASVATTLFSVAWLALITWSVTVIAHILRHTLSIHFFYAAAIAVVYVFTSMRVISALFVAGQS